MQPPLLADMASFATAHLRDLEESAGRVREGGDAVGEVDSGDRARKAVR